jgi:hypothetical protein
MTKVLITRHWSGYCRGYTEHELEVAPEELQELMNRKEIVGEYFWEGDEVDINIIRDDTETDHYEFEVVE